MEPVKVFVYGTLKQGWRANQYLGDSKFIKNTSIKGTMYDMGGFPAVTDGDNDIKGEVYEVTDPKYIAMMDRYEGHPNFYCRTKTMTVDGDEVEYYKNIDGYQGRPVIESGEWK